MHAHVRSLTYRPGDTRTRAVTHLPVPYLYEYLVDKETNPCETARVNKASGTQDSEWNAKFNFPLTRPPMGEKLFVEVRNRGGTFQVRYSLKFYTSSKAPI